MGISETTLKSLLERIPLSVFIIGVGLFVVGAMGDSALLGAPIPESLWRIAVATVGAATLLFGGFLIWNERQRSSLEAKAAAPSAPTLEDIGPDQKADLVIFLSEDLNLMDVAQLAEGQFNKRDLHTVYIYAPDFLELHDSRVFNSTLEIIDDESRSVHFYFFIEKKTGRNRFVTLLRRIKAESKIGKESEKYLHIVELDEYLFLSDYTLWNPFGPSPVGFQNLKHEGRTQICLQMSTDHLNDVATKLEMLRDRYEITGGDKLRVVSDRAG